MKKTKKPTKEKKKENLNALNGLDDFINGLNDDNLYDFKDPGSLNNKEIFATRIISASY